MSHHSSQIWLLHLQGAGEAIFVPSGWHHTVENLQDTLSINHKCVSPPLCLTNCRRHPSGLHFALGKAQEHA